MTITTEPILEKIQKNSKDHGIKSLISEQNFDFEADYFDACFLEQRMELEMLVL
jgi:hypothetical protein